MNEPLILGNIALVGFMGSGKSSVGRILARQIGHRFVDTDQLVVEAAGCEIAEIFARDGEECFRELETQALRGLAGMERIVLATGGGIVLREENVALLRALGFVVWLTAREDVIFSRVSRNQKRPLLHTADPRATVQALVARRDPLYRAAAQYAIDSSDLSHDSTMRRVLRAARYHFTSPEPRPRAQRPTRNVPELPAR